MKKNGGKAKKIVVERREKGEEKVRFEHCVNTYQVLHSAVICLAGFPHCPASFRNLSVLQTKKPSVKICFKKLFTVFRLPDQ
mmetsp:Transcript_31035/g.61200  ORF Transcript_31035/g.61200 Transcript_31035/m.61200 type:complete len:82 (-) Transcript_31035:87-332(-)